MTRHVVLVAAWALVSSASLIAGQSAPSSLQGRVVRWGTNEPLGKVTVELRRVQTSASAPFVATSAADGTFVFTSIPAGQYRVVATRAGFVRAEYGQRWPNGAGTVLTVLPGEAIGNVPIPMLQTGAISGTVRDQLGRPVGNADVDAYTATYRTGRRVLTRVQSVVSDDRGEYRLFWLTPGRYFVAVRHPELAGGPMRMGSGITMGGVGGPRGFQKFSSNGDNGGTPSLRLGPQPAIKETYTAVYYPNTPDDTAATAIEVAPGGEVQAIDFAIAPVPLHRVRGRVVYESNNEPAMSARVQALTATGGSLPGTTLDDNPGFNALFGGGVPPVASVECCDGAFEMNLPTGSYILVAAVNSLAARTSVAVGDADIDGIVLAIGREFDLKGRMTFEGAATSQADLSAITLSLALDPPATALVPGVYSNLLPNRTFTLHAGRGNFRVSIAPLLPAPGAFPFPQFLTPPAWSTSLYVKSIRLGDADVLNRGLHLDGPVPDPLEVVVATATGTLTGQVLGQDRQPLSSVMVAVIPEGEQRGRADLMKSTSSDSSGRFRLAGLPPGDYIAFAIDGPDDGESQNPETLGAREARGVAVRVSAEGTAQADLVAQPLTP